MESSAIRRPCFTDEDDELASLAEMEAGFSGDFHHYNENHPFFSRTAYYTATPEGKSSLRNLPLSYAVCSSPRLGRVSCNGGFEQHEPHFLEACFLCKKPLGENRDIFMYRGDTPFCSEECRQEQIEIDEARETNWKLSASMKGLTSKKDSKKSSSSSPTKNQNCPYRASTVAAA
ncbi:hypothetical protein Nepgr_028584 [Nepenthes gracilis]|uniref:FLZ-type domain-containing protein n=1 Tax=Nepenthes gracilis TaxID=150966 RepID=A0AAD3TCT6_NEPGR|nr:hypothetical protein Nepgr_028584 [Nepenthes gracilis]